jgi:hypothetical protein
VPKAHRESIVVAHWDTVVVHDTVRLARWLTRYDTARATVNVHDTVEVRAFVATADSTVRSCRATVLDLLSSCQAKDTLLATQGRSSRPTARRPASRRRRRRRGARACSGRRPVRSPGTTLR